MANQVAARLAGDDYQHLYAWQFALELKMQGKKVRRVTVEDAPAGSVDDVTIQHEAGTTLPDCFYQVKYHVDQRGEYSTEAFVAHKPGEASLLEKFWRTWNLLRTQNPTRELHLYLVSNWTWDAKDGLKACIDGHDNSIKFDQFFTAPPRSAIGKSRSRWQQELKASDEDFRAFISCLRFKLGFDCSEELEQRIAERMEYLHLKSDQAALLVASGIVRSWIKSGKQELSLEELEATLKTHDLYLPEEKEKCVTIYLITIKAQKFEIEPDYVIDWRDYFVGDPHKKEHQLKDPSMWNDRLLPELVELEARVNQETACRLLRARGLARLSPWFAFGFLFSEVARYIIEVDQQGRLWRTDAFASTDFHLRITSNIGSPDGEILDGEGSTVAVGISVTDVLDEDVRSYLAHRTEKVAALLLLRPERELGRECLRSASDVVALADSAKSYIRAFVKRWGARRLLLFYFGPLSGACFLGHKFNAVCQEIQVMEDQQPGYAPSFLLK
jgi:hypothetical protein